jgi:NADH-quinone oxidoreductase subunit A
MDMELNVYQNNYLIVFVFLCLGVLLPVVALYFGKLLRPNNPSDEKNTTYESGIEPFHDSRVQFNVRYYIFAPGLLRAACRRRPADRRPVPARNTQE